MDCSLLAKAMLRHATLELPLADVDYVFSDGCLFARDPT